eukprot:1299068-Karenia_brevis.AAC.1
MRRPGRLRGFPSLFLNVLQTESGSLGELTSMVCNSFGNNFKLQLYENGDDAKRGDKAQR